MALDCKINFDENALYRLLNYQNYVMRQKRIYRVESCWLWVKLHKTGWERGLYSRQCWFNSNCYGHHQALWWRTHFNFLDVGGTADADGVAKAFKIITSDPNVIYSGQYFGGMIRCDRVANGIVEAMKKIKTQGSVSSASCERSNLGSSTNSRRRTQVWLLFQPRNPNAAEKVVATIK